MKNVSFKTKITLAFFLSYILLSFYIIGLFYFKAVFAQKENLRQKLMELSTLGTRIVTAQMVEDVKPEPASMNTEEYRVLVNNLRSIMQVHPDIADVYVLAGTTVPGIMKFVGNADDKAVVPCGEDFDVTPYPELTKGAAWPSADKDITKDKWGYWLSGYAPVKRADGLTVGILGIDISAETVSGMQEVVKQSALFVFLVGILLAIVTSNLASWWLTKPLKQLVKGMDEIRSGNLNHKIALKSSDEFGKVGENFNEMAEELKRYIKNLTDTTREKERLNRELEIAAEIQQAMIPHYKLEVEGIELAGLSLPAREVGGDYFDYINRDGQNIGFVIADATGKGLPSSIFMANSKSIFKVITTEELSPAKVIQRTNNLVIDNIEPYSGMFTTMFYGIYDKKSQTFRYSNAGHNPPLYLDRDKSSIDFLNAHGCPIGVMENQDYGEDELKLKKGDMLVLFTDGVIEAKNPQNEMFGLKRLVDICLESKELAAQELINKIRDAVFAFSGDQGQFDDLTLLVFQIK